MAVDSTRHANRFGRLDHSGVARASATRLDRQPKSITPGAVLVLAALLAPGVARAGASADQAPLKAEVMHWWTSGGESVAVRELAKAYTAAGGQWVDSAVAGGESARAVAISRIIGGMPPAAAQFNISKQFNDFAAAGWLGNIDDVATQGHWDRLLPKAILDSIRVDGHYFAVPVDIHMPGWIWYSKQAFARAGIAEEPRTEAQFFAALDKLKAAGLVPLAFGGQPWQEKVTFEAVLAQLGGSELYLKVYRDHDLAAVRGNAFRAVLTTFKRLKHYVDAGAPGRNWNDATSMVVSGRAGLQIMGDWAKGEFRAAHQAAGKDYGCIVGIGMRPPYVISGDVFVFPRTADPRAVKAQHLLATTFMSTPTQIAFNDAKGSIPVRNDVDGRSMDLCAQIGLRVMSDPTRQLPGSEMLLTPELDGAMQDAITRYWNTDESADDAQAAIAAALRD